MKELQKKKKEEGLKEQNSGYTLTQLAEQYLNDSKYKKRAPTTIQGYKNLLNNWIFPAPGEHKIRTIEESALQNVYGKMKKSKNDVSQAVQKSMEKLCTQVNLEILKRQMETTNAFTDYQKKLSKSVNKSAALSL